MTTKRELRRWAAPVFGLACGAILAVIFLAQDALGSAAAAFAIGAAYSALLVLGRRNETIGLLGSGEIDERREEISRRAALASGYVLITVVVLAFAGPCRLLERVAPERRDHRHAKARIAEATDSAPFGPTVKAIIDELIATVAAAGAVAAVAPTSS